VNANNINTIGNGSNNNVNNRLIESINTKLVYNDNNSNNIDQIILSNKYNTNIL